MAVQDRITGYGNYGVARQIMDQPIVVKRYINAASDNLTSGDYYKIFAYEANTLIMRAWIVTETVEGAADTIDVTDDSSGTTTLCSNHDLNTDNAVTTYSGSVFKASAGQICIKPDAAITVAKFWVCVEYMKLSTND